MMDGETSQKASLLRLRLTYDSRKVREYLRRGIKGSIPARRMRRRLKRSRPLRFVKESYLKGRFGILIKSPASTSAPGFLSSSAFSCPI